MPQVLISEAILGDAVDALQRQFNVSCRPDLWKDADALARDIPEAQALIVRNQTRVDADLLGRANRLQVVARAGVGLDNIDVETASAAGIVVTWTPEQNAVSVAELTLGLFVALARRIPAADLHTKAGQWNRQAFHGIELAGKTLGVVGFGRIGFLVAMRARAFGMRVLAHDTWIGPDAVTLTETGARLTDLDELLRQSDFVSVHLPSTPQTRGLFNAERFAMMKPQAFFVNAARGDLVDETALADALQASRLAGAALDVRAVEPPGDSPLHAMDCVILTPHIAAFTEEAQVRVVAAVCADVASVLRGEPARYFANFPKPRRAVR
jgi:D-3-phosphoglycerate dehydrogenase